MISVQELAHDAADYNYLIDTCLNVTANINKLFVIILKDEN